MSSLLLIALLAILAIALAIYAAVSQGIESKRQHQQQLSKTLKIRYSNLAIMLTGFPQKFLNKELILFCYQCLIETCQQLVLVEAKNARYAEEIQQLRKQMLAFENKAPGNDKIPLTNLNIIQQARFHLQELYEIVEQRHKKKLLGTKQAQLHLQQIQTLMLQLSTDAYVISAMQSEADNNPKLGAHYYLLALKVLEGKKLDEYLQQRETSFKNKLQEIESKEAPHKS